MEKQGAADTFEKDAVAMFKGMTPRQQARERRNKQKR
jgi:hypothetical protein